MSGFIILKVRLGPLVSLELTGENCDEISDALKNYEQLNKKLEAMCSDLGERVYPEGMETNEQQKQEKS